MTKLAQEIEIDLKELDGVLQPIIDSCTKDSISVIAFFKTVNHILFCPFFNVYSPLKNRIPASILQNFL